MLTAYPTYRLLAYVITIAIVALLLDRRHPVVTFSAGAIFLILYGDYGGSAALMASAVVGFVSGLYTLFDES